MGSSLFEELPKIVILMIDCFAVLGMITAAEYAVISPVYCWFLVLFVGVQIWCIISYFKDRRIK